MFGRGTWAIFGLAKESLETFRKSLEDRSHMAASSQVAAAAVARQYGSDAIGINPFNAPRLDEDNTMAPEHQEALAMYAMTEQEARSEHRLPEEIWESGGFAFTAERYSINATVPWFGLWAVCNEWKNVSDLASIKEGRSYILLERPYRFLHKTDKKSVDEITTNATRIVRRQVPVLLDFNEGRVYIENGNKKVIYAITVKLRELGADVFPVAWTYNLPYWPAEILNRLYAATKYQDDFVKRAEEAKHFSPKEIEKLEDRELEGIVSRYFSMTQLPSDLWAGISTPSQIQIHSAAPPIAAKAATTATTLLHMTDEARPLSGALTFQERITFTTKEGADRTFRKDLFCLQLDDRVNLSEIGAAMLRGFNLPTLKKDVQREMRETKQVPTIDQFWSNWLQELGNAVRTIESSFREILDLDGKEEAGILPVQVAQTEEEAELVAS